MGQKTPADILEGMSDNQISDWYAGCLLTARAGLTTLRNRAGNQALSPDKVKDVIHDAFVMMEGNDEKSLTNVDDFKKYFNRLIFQSINQLHGDTRPDRNPRMTDISDDIAKSLSAMSKDRLEEMFHDRDLHRRYKGIVDAALAKSGLRVAGRKYVERLSLYSSEKFNVEDIAKDLGCTSNDVYQYRLRTKKIFGLDDE